MGLCGFVKSRIRSLQQLTRPKQEDLEFLPEDAWLRLERMVDELLAKGTTRLLERIQVRLVILQMQDLRTCYHVWRKQPEKLLQEEHVVASPFTFVVALMVLLCENRRTCVRDHASILKRCLQTMAFKDPFGDFLAWLGGRRIHHRTKPKWHGIYESVQLPSFPQTEPVDQQPPSLHGACASLRRGEGELALEMLEGVVPLGCGCACYWMGRLLFYGEAGVVRDEPRALAFFRQGVARGCLKCLNELGAYHYRRHKEDSWRYDVAIRCFNVGVSKHDPAAHLLKGLSLLDQNQPVQAWRFITRAAQLGSIQANIYLDQFQY